jgi:quinol monooxygenase YgiN
LAKHDNHARVIRVARFQPLPGKHDELITRIKPGVEAMRTGDGCFGVQVCNVREAAGIVVVVSRWANQAALDVILNAGILNQNTIKDLVTGPPSIEHYVPVAGGHGLGEIEKEDEKD